MKNKGAFKKFVGYYKPHMGLFIFDTFCCLVTAVINLIYPFIARQIINKYVPDKNLKAIIYTGVLLLFVYIVKAIFKYIIAVYGHKVGILIQGDMRNELFTHLQKLPVSYFDKNKTGTIMSRIINDLQEISELAHHGPEDSLLSFLSIIGAFIMLLNINYKLALIAFAIIPFFIIIAVFARRGFMNAFSVMRKRTGEINAEVESSVSGIRVSKAYNARENELKKFRVANKNFQDARFEAFKHMGRFQSTMTLFTDLLYLIILVFGGIFFYNNQINSGDYASFILYIGMLINPILVLITLFEQIEDGISGYRRFYEIINLEPEKEDENPIELKEFNTSIEFKDVTFTYSKEDENATNVLNNLNLVIEKGKTVALVGPSGGGKTTICNLIPRFYEIDKGELLIDGININKYSLESLRSHVGVVQQDVFLFAGSIKDNIAFGNPLASEEEIIEAAKRANIYEFAMSLPEKFDTYVGERGVMLSGGQKQRISIARAFLKNPDILILDEATSALDNVTEMQIQESLESLSNGRTTLVVAHRLSTVKNADEIVVISDKGIEERGSHEELIAKNGIYKNLYSYQFKD